MTTYPWGYGTSTVSFDELKAKARIDLMEPEFAARVFPWIESKAGNIGIGGAVRFVQPVGPTFAPAGMSFHEQQKFFDGTIWYAALDLVAKNGTSVHRSPRWDEVPKQGSGHPDITAYGVHCNVDGEPWHIQPIELDGYTSWNNAGRPRPRAGFIATPIPTPPPPGPLPTPPLPDPGGYAPGDRTLKLATPTMKGTDVSWVQNVLRNQGLTISIDSYYGRQTADRVKTMQGWNGLVKDGVVGPKTWEVLKRY